MMDDEVLNKKHGVHILTSKNEVCLPWAHNRFDIISHIL